MATEKVRLGHCPQCGPDRSADIVKAHHECYGDRDAGAWTDADYRILRCRGCSSVYFQESTVSSEDQCREMVEIDGRQEYTLPERITHWPPPVIRPKPEWSRQPHFVTKYRIVSRLLDDVYGTLNAGLKVPTAVAARTVFDAASKELDVDPSKLFFQKLDELRNKGRIGEDERRTLDVLVDAGNAAAHRGWIPSTDQLDTILSILEEFLHRAFVLKQKADNLSKEIPPRHRRKKNS